MVERLGMQPRQVVVFVVHTRGQSITVSRLTDHRECFFRIFKTIIGRADTLNKSFKIFGGKKIDFEVLRVLKT